jgi:hypothetical protein
MPPPVPVGRPAPPDSEATVGDADLRYAELGDEQIGWFLTQKRSIQQELSGERTKRSFDTKEQLAKYLWENGQTKDSVVAELPLLNQAHVVTRLCFERDVAVAEKRKLEEAMDEDRSKNRARQKRLFWSVVMSAALLAAFAFAAGSLLRGNQVDPYMVVYVLAFALTGTLFAKNAAGLLKRLPPSRSGIYPASILGSYYVRHVDKSWFAVAYIEPGTKMDAEADDD